MRYEIRKETFNGSIASETSFSIYEHKRGLKEPKFITSFATKKEAHDAVQSYIEDDKVAQKQQDYGAY